ncbi:MAG TPA: formate/nitrite transporter family protein [Candidatus Acidoferrales bacterium]|nr:formate/nitrite transporter family protein [Candidatus Acidoferrales bacterium]
MAKTAEKTTRRTAPEIFRTVEKSAHDELNRSTRSLAFSGIAGGLGMGLTGLGVASAQAALGPGNTQEFISLLFYPIGFISVIIGRAQLFTENTLYPVALLLSERRHFLDTLRLWVVVFVCNVLGAILFATIAIRAGALHREVASALVSLGEHAVQGEPLSIFASGIFGGWIIALTAWTVSASHWTIGQIAVVWFLTVVVGMGHFAHCIASSGEILSAVLAGHVAWGSYAAWLTAATAGNIVGGVTFVTVLNFGQVSDEYLPAKNEEE